jgi:hypothetical protein
MRRAARSIERHAQARAERRSLDARGPEHDRGVDALLA